MSCRLWWNSGGTRIVHVQYVKKDEAATQLRSLTSAMDKAAKSGVMHRSAADRKKSRLAVRLARMK